MTSKIKCPFCKTELIGNSQASYCNQCAIYGYNEIWQALIQAKQDLEIARKALKDIQWFCYAPTIGECASRMQQRADKTLKQIEHKEI